MHYDACKDLFVFPPQEVDAMEAELKIMEKDVTELRSALTSKQGISQDKFRVCVCVCEMFVNIKGFSLDVKTTQSLFFLIRLL